MIKVVFESKTFRVILMLTTHCNPYGKQYSTESNQAVKHRQLSKLPGLVVLHRELQGSSRDRTKRLTGEFLPLRPRYVVCKLVKPNVGWGE